MDQEREQYEAALVARAGRDPEAFGRLYDLYYDDILNYVARRTGDAQLAYDITAETFARALKGVRRFQWRGISFSAWLYRIASNEVAGHYRRSDARRLVSLECLVEEAGADWRSAVDLEAELIAAQDALDRDREFLACRELLGTLPPKYQEVISLRYFAGRKVAEIAEILGKREGTVKSLLHRGLNTLGTAMAEQSPERNLSLGPAFKAAEGLSE